ncbi:histidine kinase [Streptomyces sp. NPDC088923]|uniref:histidine kinase n=1 Tax=Streptomyces sp. NPDC088923 TaxID=3365913 RepID=UPI00382BF7F4
MRKDVWSAWPSREALSRESRRRVESEARTAATRGIRVTLLGFLVWISYRLNPDAGPARMIGGLVLVVLAIAALRRFFRVTAEQRLRAAVPCIATLLLSGAGAYGLGWQVAASVAWCLAAVVALERLPLGWGAPAAFLGLGGYFLTDRDDWIATLVTCGGLALAGFVTRLDAEARGAAHRLLIEERASQAARAESAALAERARIARDIHDVLAHSLSAQLVHLEAARIQIEQGADRRQVLERVVAARGMAREGLEETRQALSALRGDMAPVAEALAELAAREGTVLRVEGEARPVAAEAGQTLRRVAQEALTNVRKHAPGARPRLRLVYGSETIELEVRNGPGRQSWGERAAWGERSFEGGGFDGAGRSEGSRRATGVERAEPADRVEVAERAEQGARAETDERAEWAEVAEPAAQAVRAEGAERAARAETDERTERAEAAEQAERAEPAEQAVRADGPEWVARAERGERAEGASGRVRSARAEGSAGARRLGGAERGARAALSADEAAGVGWAEPEGAVGRGRGRGGVEGVVSGGDAVGVEDVGGADLAGSGSGYGVRGMRERAELLGGTLSAGPPEDGEEGFVVRLRVPA